MVSSFMSHYVIIITYFNVSPKMYKLYDDRAVSVLFYIGSQKRHRVNKSLLACMNK